MNVNITSVLLRRVAVISVEIHRDKTRLGLSGGSVGFWTVKKLWLVGAASIQ